MLEALLKDTKPLKELIAFQEEIVAAVGKEKAEVEIASCGCWITSWNHREAYSSDLQKAVQVEEKLARSCDSSS